jgi:Hypothetical protein (DUF2513)
VAGDEISDAGRLARFRRWDELGLDRVKADLMAGGHALVGGPSTNRALAWEWVELKEQRPIPLKRDMDLIRMLLLEIESGTTNFVTFPLDPIAQKKLADPQEAKLRGEHLHLLHTGGMIDVTREDLVDGLMIVRGLTWQGHEFLDAVRDPEIWRKTKERAKAITTVGVSLLWEIAKAEIRTKLGLP